MIPKGLFMQIVVVIVSITIVLFYIEPSFAEVQSIQSSIKNYELERGKVVKVNSQLSALVAKMESVSADDQRRLLTYLPNTVDPLAVSRDLILIAKQAGVTFNDVQAAGQGKGKSKKVDTVATEENTPIPHFFTLSVEGTYEQIKNLFRLLEQNKYPLEVQGVNIAKADGNFLVVTIDIAAYSLSEEVTNN